jgi:hypothetical protein
MNVLEVDFPASLTRWSAQTLQEDGKHRSLVSRGEMLACTDASYQQSRLRSMQFSACQVAMIFLRLNQAKAYCYSTVTTYVNICALCPLLHPCHLHHGCISNAAIKNIPFPLSQTASGLSLDQTPSDVSSRYGDFHSERNHVIPSPPAGFHISQFNFRSFLLRLQSRYGRYGRRF